MRRRGAQLPREKARPRWIPFYNNSGEEIPPYAILRPTAVTKRGGARVLDVDRPSSTDFARIYYVNGPRAVPYHTGGQSATGLCSRSGWIDAAYDPADGVPARGEGWGPKPGSWLLHKDYYGFTIAGGESSVTIDGAAIDRVIVEPQEIDEVQVVLDAALAYQTSTGSLASVYVGSPGSQTVTAWKVRAYDWHLLPGETVPAGTHATLQWHHGYWYVDIAACDPDVNATAPGGGGGGGSAGGSSGSTTMLLAQPSNSNPALWPPTTYAFPWGN